MMSGGTMKKTRIAFAIGFIFSFQAMAFSFGSNETPLPAYKEFPQSLGFQYGEISGTGLSYQLWRETVGFQISGGVVYLPLDEGFWFDRTLDYLVGGELQLRVYGEDFASWLSGQLYGFAGLNHGGYIPVVVVKEELQIGDDERLPAEHGTGSFTPTFGFGAGIGIEIIFFRHFS